MEAIRVFGLKLSYQTILLPPCKFCRFPLTSFPSKPARLVPLKATSLTLACDNQESNRKFKELAPSQWGHQFASAHVDLSEMDELGREIEAQKPKVRDMLMSSKGTKSSKKVLFIYLLVSLGIAYHFEDEIKVSLKDAFQNIEEMMEGENDLYTVSIIFWVFRTYYHNISSDVFRRFKADNGQFKKCLVKDTKGMLSLYEAANMGTTTDYILDEATSFTLSYLESLAAMETCKHNLARRIRKALDQPQHKNMEILVALEYIKFYEQEEDCDKTLLKFAKLNFKFLQLHYLQELKILSKWYKGKDFESKLPPYYRDRLVEIHFASLATLEPKYSRARIFLSKIYTVQIFLDDTCDRYASFREVEKLVETIQRWDPDGHGMDGEADYLKYVVKFVFDTFQEFEKEVCSEIGGSYSLKATIEESKRSMRNNLQLAKWVRAGHLPSLDEYLDVAGLEIALYCTFACILMGMENVCKEEAYTWLKARDKLLRAIILKTRLVNDIHGYEDDMNRGYVTNSINCYKKQYGVTKEEAIRKLYEMVANTDKIMNEEFLKTTNVPHEVLRVVLIDTFRSANVSYEKDDEFTRPGENIKNSITSLYIDL